MDVRWPSAALPLLLLLALPFATPSESSEGPVVTVAQGQLRGLRIERSPNTTLRTVYAFEGVPYARPPVGERRFKDPEESLPWTGVRNATSYGPNCVQRYLDVRNFTGEEDCLYLNIFTADPPETWATVKRPVIVFFHGGAFVQWNGNMVFARPDPLLQQGVVFVSLNYRLAVMGFLNTEDSQAPGNAGLKDQSLALRWVQKNIAAFGGDPGNVTIMGESAGAGSVHYHMLSPLSRGLFQRAVSVSGSALAPWASVRHPRRYARALRRLFADACPDLPEGDIVPCLRRVDAKELVLKEFDITPLDEYENYFLKNRFLPSVEVPSASNAPFLTADPEQLLRAGQFAQVPYITGFVSGEGILWLYFAGLLGGNATARWAEVDDHLEDIFRWELPEGLRTREVARRVRTFYLGDRSLRGAASDNDTLQRFTLMIGDVSNNLGQVRSAGLMAERGATVYVYEFTRDGPIAFIKQGGSAANHSGVLHGDDMAYVFDFTTGGPDDSDPRPVPASEQPIRERQAKIFTNFAKTGNPTPEGSGLVHWPAYTSEAERYLQMDVELSVRTPAMGDRIAFWRTLLQESRANATDAAPSTTEAL